MKSFQHLTTVIALMLLAFPQVIASADQLKARSDTRINTRSVTVAQTSPDDINAYLAAHNSVRAQHSAAPLSWDDQLADQAQQWANRCVFEHSAGPDGGLPSTKLDAK